MRGACFGGCLVLGVAAAVCALSCSELKTTSEKSCLLDAKSEHYLQCVKTRIKRQRDQEDCEYDSQCFECDCKFCSYQQCGGQCDHCCHSCCTNYVRCHTNHCCHKQCHAECRDRGCRGSCRKSCHDSVRREKTSAQERPVATTVERGQTTTINNNTNRHNVTTIINLRNVLNNTSILDLPINLTFSNRNNITLQEALQETASDCCIVIGPKQCVSTQTPPYVRCFHTRSRQCGSYCTATEFDAQEIDQQTCKDSFGKPTNCKQETSPLQPQPSSQPPPLTQPHPQLQAQPQCSFIPTWPYMVCGMSPPSGCESCNWPNFNPDNRQHCRQECFESAPFRQGPFYQSPIYPQMPLWNGGGYGYQYPPINYGYPEGAGVPFQPQYGIGSAPVPINANEQPKSEPLENQDQISTNNLRKRDVKRHQQKQEVSVVPT